MSTTERTEARAPTYRPPTFHDMVRWPELLIGSVLFARGYYFGPEGAGYPLSEVAVGALAFVTLVRRPTGRRLVVSPLLLLALFGIALADLSLVSAIHGAPWFQRVGRVASFGVIAFGVMSGRLHLKSILIGMSGGFLVNAGLYYAGLAPDNYIGYLTGWAGDKNYAGLYAAAIPLLVCAHLPRRWQRLTVLAVFGYLVFLTGSRTSMIALLLGALWTIVSTHRSVAARVGIVAVFYGVFSYVEEHYARVSIFAERWGTDILRDRIDAAATAKVNAALPWGLGAGEGEVLLNGKLRFLFHNSYQTLLVEGGWILAGSICLIIVIALFSFGPYAVRSRAVRYGEAAIIAVGICAISLGEVHFTGISALSIGAVIHLRTQAYETLVREVQR
ncbi:MAG: hypothetical protein Q4P36_05875 [Bowdeniella nasicola]|nr:hypothetical protein [Bowdeniella nasicola]